MKNKHQHNHNSESINKVCFKVEGVHCAACESLIEGTVNDLKGVKASHADLSSNTVIIETHDPKDFPTNEILNKELNELGYKFHRIASQPKENMPEEQTTISVKEKKNEDMFLAGTIAILILIGMYFLQKAGFISNATISPTSTLTSFVIFGIAASVSSCAALVGSLLLSLGSQWNKDQNSKSTFPFILFNIGRLFSFAILGALLGVLGSYLKVSENFNAIIVTIVSVFMIIIALQMLGVSAALKIKLSVPESFIKNISNEENFKGKYMPFIAGFLTFFLPCGFTFIAQTNALASGDALKSGSMLLAFALGTLPMLLLISFSSIKLYANRQFSAVFNFTAAFLILAFALSTITAQLNLINLGNNKSTNAAIGSATNEKELNKDIESDETSQSFNMIVNGFSYYPNEVNLKANVPVKWRIDNKGATGCAQSVAGRGLFKGSVVLQPGINEYEFTPKNKGVFKISCSMGMVPPITVYVN